MSGRGHARIGIALIYHGLAARAGDRDRELLPPVDTRLFDEQLRHLKAAYHVVRPSELLAAAAERRPGSPVPVAVTFDDDLRSHAELAAPALDRAGVAAGFFLSGASLDRPHSFWWEDLQTLVDRGGEPRRLESMAALELEPAFRRRPRAIHEVAASIEALPPERLEAVAAELRALAGEQPVDRWFTSADVAELGRDFEIGFHTLRHHRLPQLSDAQLDNALHEGRERLEAAVGNALTMISYPHGRADTRIARAARRAGFVLGFTTVTAAVRSDTDSLLVPRVRARGGSAESFVASLADVVAAACHS